MKSWLIQLTKQVGRPAVAALTLGTLLSGCVSDERTASPVVVSKALGQETFDWERLAPGVADFIRGSALSHKAEFPDADEPLEALQAFVKGQELLARGEVDAAILLYLHAVELAPQARHVHLGLGRALLQRYELAGVRADLEAAADAFVQAHRVALERGRVRYTAEVARTLGELKDVERLSQVFTPLVTRVPGPVSWSVSLDYAAGLARAGSAEAGVWYQRSVQARPEGALEPVIQYARWLLARGRAGEALAVLEPRPGEDLSILRFYRGYAAEQLGDTERARREYRLAVGFSELFPLPAIYRTTLAALVGVAFDDALQAQSHCAGHTKLSEVISCEARGEGLGVMRAVGWSIRTRVFMDPSQTSCPINNGGSTVCDKYYNVITQPGQYNLCGARTSTSDSVAYDVFYGRVPDPYSRWCPAGSASSNDYCSAVCSASSSAGASPAGPVFFSATSGGCGATHPSGCGGSPGKTCGDGSTDLCFYRAP